MASLKFRHYATESDLRGTGTIQAALNAFDVGTIVFIDSTQKQYIITSKTNNVVTYKIYYGEPAVVSVSGSGAARTLTWSDGREETVTINDVDHATSADVSDTTKSVAWANVTGKPNIVTTDTEQTISGSKIFNNNTTFHNETDMESLTTDSLLVTGSARFTNTINGNLKGNVEGNLTGNASSATKATNDGSGNTITSTYATKTERANNDITAVSLTASKLTLTRTAGNITANIPTWNQDTTGTAAKATSDANGNNIINTYATKAEVAALPKSMVIKGTLDATHTLPTSGMTEGDTYIVGTKGTYNSIACKVGDFFVRTSDSWLRIPAGDEWEYNENTIKGIKVNNAGHADTAGAATTAGSATSDSSGNNIVNTYARIDKVYDDSSTYRQFLGKSGSSSDWIRTTTNGLLPYTSGDASNGHSSLGTSSWYFSKAYIQNIYGYLNGNISGSSTSCSGNSATASKLTNLSSTDTASESAVWRKVWFSYSDGITGRPSLSDNFVYQTSTNTLKVPNLTLSGNETINGTITVTGKASFNGGLTGTLTGNLIGNADTATTASSCSGNSATATKAVTAASLGSGALTHMCSLHAMERYSAYKIVTDWNKSDHIMPTINIRGYAYGTSCTIDCDIVIYHFNNASCSYSITNKGSYPIRVWQNIENDVQVFYISPGEYCGMFNVFVYSGARTNLLTKWSMTPVSEVSGTEIGCKPIATSITGNAATATIASSCSGNSGTATKLQTARTLWGQSFDGSKNVDGCLHIASDNIGNYTQGIRINQMSAGTDVASIWLATKNAIGYDTGMWGISATNNGNLRFRGGATSPSDLMVITQSGNIGIGTTSPTSKLHVAGVGYFTGDVSSATNIIAGGYIKGETVKISSGCTLEYDSTQKCVKFVFS